MVAKELLPNVFVLPSILTMGQIEELLGQRGYMGACGPGSGDDEGHVIYEPIPPRPPRKEEREPGYHKRPVPPKPHDLPDTARALERQLGITGLPERFSTGVVDQRMKLYRFTPGSGAVAQHRDEDFDVGGLNAQWSLLVYLNDAFSQGETIFEGAIAAPHQQPGGALLFKHDVLHEGVLLGLGEKYVLKTDIAIRE